MKKFRFSGFTGLLIISKTPVIFLPTKVLKIYLSEISVTNSQSPLRLCVAGLNSINVSERFYNIYYLVQYLFLLGNLIFVFSYLQFLISLNKVETVLISQLDSAVLNLKKVLVILRVMNGAAGSIEMTQLAKETLKQDTIIQQTMSAKIQSLLLLR